MTIHFAAARKGATSPLVRALTRRDVGHVANDNGANDSDRLVLDAALRHFAQHGLGAAANARSLAEAAFFEGDRERYDWWHNVCQTLDRRVARNLSSRFDPASGS